MAVMSLQKAPTSCLALVPRTVPDNTEVTQLQNPYYYIQCVQRLRQQYTQPSLGGLPHGATVRPLSSRNTSHRDLPQSNLIIVMTNSQVQTDTWCLRPKRQVQQHLIPAR
jgi:hypothetical protein